MTIVDKLVLALSLDTTEYDQGSERVAKNAQEAEKAYSQLGDRWASTIKGTVMSIAAPIASGFAIFRSIAGYASQVAEVATLTGAYSTQLEEWRKKRALLSRVTRDDIELYKKGREAVVSFQITMDDLTAKIARNFSPALKWGIELLEGLTKWIDRNKDNLARFFTIAATAITTVLLPSIVKLGVAMMTNPLTWIIASLVALALVIDDLVVYIRGGKSQFEEFWSIFGTGEQLSKVVTNALKVLKDVLSTIAPVLGALALSFAAVKIGSVIFSGLQTAVLGLRTAFMLLAANPIVAVLMAIAAAFVYLWRVWQQAGGDLSKIGQIIWDDLKDITKKILNFLGSIGGIIANVIGWLASLVMKIFGFDDETIEKIRNGFSKVADFLGNLGENLFALGDHITEFFTGLSNNAQEFAVNLWTTFTDRLARLKENFGGFVDSVKNFFRDLLADILAWLSGLPERFTNVFEQITQTIRDVFTSAWEWIKSLFNPAELLGDLTSGLKNITGEIADFFGFGGDNEGEEDDSTQVENQSSAIDPPRTNESSDVVPITVEPTPAGNSETTINNYYGVQNPTEVPNPAFEYTGIGYPAQGEESQNPQAPVMLQAPSPEPVPSNGAKAWALNYQAQQAQAVAPQMNSTQNYQNAVYNNQAATYNNRSVNAPVTQNNTITINGSNGNPREVARSVGATLNTQSANLNGRVMAVETGTRI